MSEKFEAAFKAGDKDGSGDLGKPIRRETRNNLGTISLVSCLRQVIWNDPKIGTTNLERSKFWIDTKMID